MEVKFYRCRICGQIAVKVKETKAPLVCCGERMEELLPDSVDASQEKHVPVVEVKGNNAIVSIGSEPHPMSKEHFIEWVFLQTEKTNQYRELKPGMEPAICFALCEGDEVKAAYIYCNLHGLWKT